MRRAWFLALALIGVVVPSARAGEGRAAAERRLESLASADATQAFRLALTLESEGFVDLAKKAYERVVDLDPENVAARRALGFEKVSDAWLAGDDLFRAKGFVHHGGKWLTSQEFAEATRPQREAAEQKAGEERVLALLSMVATEDEAKTTEARRLLALEPARFKLAPLAQALRCRPASLRIFAAEELGRLGDPLGVPPLLKRTIDDDSVEVRKAAALALKEIGAPETIHPLGRALASRYEDVRVHAAEAIGFLGDELGLPYVIERWEKRSGDFPRVFFSQVNQISYIQDFDVEVAQTSFIADPIVGVLQEGVVQAVKILATEVISTRETQAYHKSLQSMVGTDLGSKPAAWRSFWHENKDRLLQERADRLAKADETASH